MNSHIKNGLIFIGGITIGGVAAVSLAFRSQTLRKGIAQAVAEKIVMIALREEPAAEKRGPLHRYVRYHDIYKREYQPEEENS